ncbi:DUF2789 family protein [Limnohabitans sp. Jir72]|uniref:DUF2789 family protein n=1 Tax=Limnohabitans sp. Jir72 TaxID=1977909 RepID=UPI000D34633C|nr:DUF2789 family protein [Limnohabitans sp. Jir72]PUE33885.1 hypothetical protein B9Z52_07240 [Limnohabitans sp. Jir72]
MEQGSHAFHELFAQLGLACDRQGIEVFLKAHRALTGDVALSEAPFWTPAQAAFLRESVMLDADWAQQAEQLSQALRWR